MSLVKVWDKEIKGKLYAVGDIHGCYNLLMNRLNEIGFDFENDLLVAVGDLVDRGIQNHECVDLLNEDWFTSVRGNHEDLCIWGAENNAAVKCHIDNGGEWFYQANKHRQKHIIEEFLKLPIVLEVNHNGKKYGFVHGHIEQNDWVEFKQSFDGGKSNFRDPAQLAMWGRERLNSDNHQYAHVSGIDAVIMGHTVTQKPCKRDNCYWIDTGAVHWGTMTILDLSKV
ncbi:metallophosphoesterase [Acinetobacter bereziniae]|uniref:metallophosphoesterase n=1 Tax=Acinetobacter bereziniae TaxID=106648 RepID=UPI001901DDEC|nr:metallophosphoesterase [Acinetobacter bereziniae]MBJ9902058.1 metallophosphoesterase [Acinetobacter bereziniae]MCU4317920.1 metallophosphoesterase [Acinetobacter bereziniae]MCU4597733.1 metallophosphoesterase [Acinetobacter bereziniae]